MSQHDHPYNEEEFNAFLQGEGGLNRELQSLGEEPSAALSATIMRRAAQQIHDARQQKEAVNDGVGNSSLAKPSIRPVPHYLRRKLMASALAASAVIAVALAWQWQSADQESDLTVAALKPQPQSQRASPAAASVPSSVTNRSVPAPAAPAAAPNIQIAATSDTQDSKPGAPVAKTAKADANPDVAREEEKQRRATATIAADTARASPSKKIVAQEKEATRIAIARLNSEDIGTGSAPPPPELRVYGAAGVEATVAAPNPDPNAEADAEGAKSWLTSIAALIDDGRQQDALEQWQKFNKRYPGYRLSASLVKKIGSLKQ